MKRNFAVTTLVLLLAMNIGSGWTQRIDRQMLRIESSLCSDADVRACIEQGLDAERKLRSRAQTCAKA